MPSIHPLSVMPHNTAVAAEIHIIHSTRQLPLDNL